MSQLAGAVRLGFDEQVFIGFCRIEKNKAEEPQ